MKKLSFRVILSAIFVIIGYTFASAEKPDLASDYLCQYGIKLYKAGDTADSIHELKKALLINPNHALAQEYLRKILEQNQPQETLLPAQPYPAANVYLKPVSEERDDRLELLRQQANELKAANQSYLNQLQSIKQDYSSKEAEVFRLQQQIAGQKENEYALTELRAQLDALQAEAIAKDNRIKELEDKNSELADLTAQLADKDAQIKALRKDWNLADGELEGLKSEIPVKDALIKNLEVDLKQAQESSAQQLADYKDKIDALNKSKAEKEEALSAATEKLKIEKGSAVDAAQKELALMKEQLSKLNAQLQQAQQEAGNKDGQVKSLQEQARTSERDYAAKLTQAKDKLAALENSLVVQNKQIADINKELKSERESLNSALDNRDKELANKEPVIAGLKKELASVQEQFNNTKNQLIAAQQSGIEQDSQVKALQEQIKALKESSEAGVTEYKTKAAILEKDILDKDNASAKALADLQLQKDKFNSQLAEYKDRIAALEEVMADKDSGVLQLGSAVKAKDQELADKESKITALEKEQVAAKDQIEQLNSQLLQAQQESQAKDVKAKALEKEVQETSHDLSSELAKTQEENVRLQEQMQSLKDKLLLENHKEVQAKDTQIKNLQDKIKALQDGSAAQLAGYNDKIAALEKESADKDKTISLIEQQRKALEAEKKATADKLGAQIAGLNATMDKLQKDLQSEITNYQAKLEMSQRGIVLRVLTDVLFDSGSSRLSAQGKSILNRIADTLKKMSKEHLVRIEGHTDNEPIRYSRWKSNWDLSSGRALSVLEQLLRQPGLDPVRFSVVGLGEYSPVADNFTKEGRRQNRRVEIVIQPQVIKVKNEL